ncbi:peptidoglycan DD-metalloendopeptidase family protein [Streptomyces lonarensis]|uniref:Peptidoglycan DD-metalloendopeptidase family protein n=1 Tax=Streptomyces lonarensis TaxID=700599 RepID=A0A7X6CY50_9ACTN|nr:peptidoglycan DD-metalloendopeptidase family protein [Streptomyces lonarensis]NJQ04564.1 peptidoglycan DD-metalloendopeptidase family protein [Streptomyces lonarensis]
MFAPRNPCSRWLLPAIALAAAALACAVGLPLGEATARAEGGTSGSDAAAPSSAKGGPRADRLRDHPPTVAPVPEPPPTRRRVGGTDELSESPPAGAGPGPVPGSDAVLTSPLPSPVPPSEEPPATGPGGAVPPTPPGSGSDDASAAAAARPWTPGAGGDWPLSPPPALLRLWEPPAAPWAPGHRGVDLAARPGHAVRAAVHGRISFAGPVAGRPVLVIAVAGTTLRLTHEPVVATVAVGATVRRGDIVGVVAEGPFHCAEGCVHWGLLDGSTYLDPLSLLRRGPSRLLPVLDVPLPSPSGVEALPQPVPDAAPAAVRSSGPARRAAPARRTAAAATQRGTRPGSGPGPSRWTAPPMSRRTKRPPGASPRAGRRANPRTRALHRRTDRGAAATDRGADSKPGPGPAEDVWSGGAVRRDPRVTAGRGRVGRRPPPVRAGQER